MTAKKRIIKNYWVTPEDIIRAQPCEDNWPKSRIMNWFRGRKKVRLTTILTDENIPEKDRLWLFSGVIYMRDEVHREWWIGYTNVSLEKIIQAIE